MIRLPRQEANAAETPEAQSRVDVGRTRVAQALKAFGEGNAEIAGTDAVGAVAGKQLRNQAVAVTLSALVGILLFIGFRFEWTYDSIAVASPIMGWWQKRLGAGDVSASTTNRRDRTPVSRTARDQPAVKSKLKVG